MNVEPKDFTLSALVMNKNGNGKVSYKGVYSLQDAEQVNERKLNDTETKWPLPDFVESMDELAMYAVDVQEDIGLTRLLEHVNDEEAVRKLISDAIDKREIEMRNNYIVDTIKFTGGAKNEAVTLEGDVILYNNKKTRFITPFIIMDSTTYGWEVEFKRLIDKITLQAYGYIFLNMYAKPSECDEDGVIIGDDNN